MTAGIKAPTSTTGSLQINGVDAITFDSTGILTGVNKTAVSQMPTLGLPVATTSGTAIDFTSIPSWVKRITLSIYNLSSTGANNYLVQLGSGSITTSGYLGSGTRANGGSGSTVTSNLGTTGFILHNLSGATNVVSGSIIFTILNSSTNIWVCQGIIGNSDSAATSYVGGGVTLSGTLDRLRLTTVGGTDTLDLGTANILYE